MTWRRKRKYFSLPLQTLTRPGGIRLPTIKSAIRSNTQRQETTNN
jgi:hypothetical protein